MEKFVPRTSFFHKVRPDAGIKLPFFDPRLEAYFTAPRSIIPKRRKRYRLRKIDFAGD